MAYEKNGVQLTPFHYDLVIMAETQKQADKILVERLGFEEDLSEYGVGEYIIDADPVGGRELDPLEDDEEESNE